MKTGINVIFISFIFLTSSKVYGINFKTIHDSSQIKKNYFGLELNTLFTLGYNFFEDRKKTIPYEIIIKRRLNTEKLIEIKAAFLMHRSFSDTLSYLENYYKPPDTIPDYNDTYYLGNGYQKGFTSSIRFSSGIESRIFNNFNIIRGGILFVYEHSLIKSYSKGAFYYIDTNITAYGGRVAEAQMAFKLNQTANRAGLQFYINAEHDFNKWWGLHFIMSFSPLVTKYYELETVTNDPDYKIEVKRSFFDIRYHMSLGLHFRY